MQRKIVDVQATAAVYFIYLLVRLFIVLFIALFYTVAININE